MSTEPRITIRRPVEEQLRPALDEEGVARVWRSLRERGALDRAASSERARRRSRTFAGVGVLAVAAAALFVAWSPQGVRRGLASPRGVLAAGDPIMAASAPVVLDDDSTLSTARDTQLEVLANDGERFVTLLRRGRCHFAVTPGGPRRWTIETDLATVEVVGTEFTVERGDAGLVVTVDHGVVLVRGEHVPGRVRRLHAGDRLALTDDTPQGAPAAAPAVVRTPHTGNAARAEETPLTDGTPRANVSMTPADVGAQRVDLDATRPPARVATPDSPAPDLDAMLARADAARARGDTREAARWLTELEQTHGDDPRGALAAFTLGRIQLEGLHEPRAAAATFARIVARGTPRALLEDAQARRVEALLRAGDLTEARHALAELERRWPSARRLDEARALVRAAEGSPGE